MNRNNQPWGALAPAAIDWDPSGAPLSTRFDDVYYSREDGAAESRHVFLDGNGLPQRFAHHDSRTFCIAETGFGTGLNFLLAWESWAGLAPSDARLHYVAIERFPLAPADIHRALAPQQSLQDRRDALLAHYPPLLPGQHRLLFDGGRVTLDLWFEDVRDSLEDLAASSPVCVDAWFLDGFAPARNQAMWQPAVYRSMAALSRPGATLATFTAAGHVRRGLVDAGFEMEKIPGFGRKRECLRGRLASVPPPALPGGTPWDLPQSKPRKAASALVIGGGLAGCATAASLAARGVQVTLLERDAVAGAGSGNAQGILYTRLSHRHATLTDFAVHSFLYASRHYQALFAQGRLQAGSDGQLCGNFQQVEDTARLERLQDPLLALEQLAEILSAEAASDRLGLDQPHPGLWYPGSGWLNPPAVCRALIAQERITVRERCGEIHLDFDGEHWHALAAGQRLATAPCAVLATGAAHPGLHGLDWLPIQSIRGQTTEIPSQGQLADLRACLCHEGYIAPARGGRHTIGASFILDTLETTEHLEEHRENLQKLGTALPGVSTELPPAEQVASGRVGFRCASSDYLPAVGQVPEHAAFLQTFSALGKNARSPIASKGPYVPGLYLNIAHGSRGLTTTPLCAELLASQVCGEALPLERELLRALAPARFLVRQLVRGADKS